jgi:cytoskeletal protein CcmA (bactofilin family)
MSANKREDFSVNTIIGPNTHINGDVNSAGFTRVDGSLRGNLIAEGRIIVGERARMKSSITGTAITIGGVVSGNVLASERVIILATGIVLGDIITQRIQADEGCLLYGRITVCQTHEKWNNAVNEYRDREDVKSVTAAFAPQPNPAAAEMSPAEFSPEDGIQAAVTAPAETVPPAAEPETMIPAVADQTPVFGYTVLPREPFFAGEQTVPESPAGESPPENAAFESTPASPEESPMENTPLTPDWAAFPENAPDTPENTSEIAPVSPDESSTENTPLTPDWAAFPENTPDTPENASEIAPVSPDESPTENTPFTAEDTLPKNTTFPAVPFPGAVNTGENHGES